MGNRRAGLLERGCHRGRSTARQREQGAAAPSGQRLRRGRPGRRLRAPHDHLAANEELLLEITGLIGDGVDEVRFETAEKEAVVRAGDELPRAAAKPEPSKDRGTLVGRVQTLQGRGQLRFTLYDLAHDRAVSCWLSSGQQELMRGAWGHLVEVEGLVSWDPVTNMPLSVRRVTDVRIFDEPVPDAWLLARGAVQAPTAPPAEQVIRQLRDVW